MKTSFWHDWLAEFVFVPEVVMLIDQDTDPDSVATSLITALLTIPEALRGDHWCELMALLKTGELDGCLRSLYHREG